MIPQTKTPTPQGCLAIIEVSKAHCWFENECCPRTQCNAWKRFSDFQHLEKELEQIHVASGVLVKFPSLIKASYFGTVLLFCKRVLLLLFSVLYNQGDLRTPSLKTAGSQLKPCFTSLSTANICVILRRCSTS